MHEIICPHCSKAFKIDEAGYADILKQVHDKEFEKQLHERLEAASLERQTALELVEAKAMGKLEKITAKKNGEIQTLKAKLEAGELAQYPRRRYSLVAWWLQDRLLIHPFLDRISGYPRPPHDLAQRQLVAQPKPSDLANHVHCDHLVPPA